MTRLVIATISVGLLAGVPIDPRIHIEIRDPARHPPVVTVTFSNPGTERVDLTGTGAIELSAKANAFWAPFDLEKFRPVGPNLRSSFVLEAGAERRVELDLGQLRWAREISSIWPQTPLASAVPAGTYALLVRIQAADERRIVSNGVVVTIK